MLPEITFGPFLWIIALLPFILLGATFASLFFEGRVEIDTTEAVVFKNIWTGAARAYTQGTHFIFVWRYKQLTPVTLKNEPSDPPIEKVKLRDGAEVGVDYVIQEQRVLGDPSAEFGRFVEKPENIVKAATKTNPAERTKNILVKIATALQSAFGEFGLVDFTGYGAGIPNKPLLTEIAWTVNQELLTTVTEPWGVWVEIRIENLILPQKVQEVAEETATSEREGAAIKKKAEAAGVPAWIMAVGDVIQDIVRGRSGGKEGDEQ